MIIELPSGLARIEMHHPMGEQEGSYPVRRKDLESAMMEAMVELWKTEHERKRLDDTLFEIIMMSDSLEDAKNRARDARAGIR